MMPRMLSERMINAQWASSIILSLLMLGYSSAAAGEVGISSMSMRLYVVRARMSLGVASWLYETKAEEVEHMT